ncbi:MAG TPA: RNA polymerase sigma factor [Solirubrobacterales bacterium]|nr:RNA polymerase sigma factor [Solirubrobacterales bacterium]
MDTYGTVIERGPSPGDSNMDRDRRKRFEALFRTTHPRVLAYALRRAPDRESAEEVVSETYLIAWRRFDAVPREDPLPWLLGTARRVRSNQRRAATRRPHATGAVPIDGITARDPVTPAAEALAEREAFAAAFAALRERDREVLSLIAWDGLRVREAATVMGCTSAVFSLRLHRARGRLLKELKRSGHSLGEANGQPPLVEQPGTTEA